MDRRQKNRACGWLLGAGMMMTALSASADPCRATAVVSGDPTISAQLSTMLAAREIAVNPAEGCPALWATVSVSNGSISLSLKDSSGKAETFQVVELATAAALIEAWSRASLEPLLPPGVDDSSEDAASVLDALAAEAPEAPSLAPEDLLPPEPPVIPAPPAPPGRRSVLSVVVGWRPLVPSPNAPSAKAPAFSQKGIQVSGEYVGGGYRSEGRGLSVSAQIPHRRFPKFQLSAEGRAYQLTGGTPGSSLVVVPEGVFYSDSFNFDGSSVIAELPIAKTLYQGSDAMLRLARPLSWRRLSFTPSLAAGVGFASARDLIANLDLPTISVSQNLFEAQGRLSYQLRPSLSLNVFGSTAGAVNNRDFRDFAFMDEGIALEPAPDSYQRFGFGITYQRSAAPPEAPNKTRLRRTLLPVRALGASSSTPSQGQQ